MIHTTPEEKQWHVFLEQHANPLSSGLCHLPYVICHMSSDIIQMAFGSVR